MTSRARRALGPRRSPSYLLREQQGLVPITSGGGDGGQRRLGTPRPARSAGPQQAPLHRARELFDLQLLPQRSDQVRTRTNQTRASRPGRGSPEYNPEELSGACWCPARAVSASARQRGRRRDRPHRRRGVGRRDRQTRAHRTASGGRDRRPASPTHSKHRALRAPADGRGPVHAQALQVLAFPGSEELQQGAPRRSAHGRTDAHAAPRSVRCHRPDQVTDEA
jgi:hypothetical protein